MSYSVANPTLTHVILSINSNYSCCRLTCSVKSEPRCSFEKAALIYLIIAPNFFLLKVDFSVNL